MVEPGRPKWAHAGSGMGIWGKARASTRITRTFPFFPPLPLVDKAFFAWAELFFSKTPFLHPELILKN